MDHERERALTLAHEAERKDGFATPTEVVARARKYLDFLRGTHDAEIIEAAHVLADKIGRPTAV